MNRQVGRIARLTGSPGEWSESLWQPEGWRGGREGNVVIVRGGGDGDVVMMS